MYVCMYVYIYIYIYIYIFYVADYWMNCISLSRSYTQNAPSLPQSINQSINQLHTHKCRGTHTTNWETCVTYLLYPPPPGCWLGETATLSGVERFTVGFTLFTCLLLVMEFTIAVGVFRWLRITVSPTCIISKSSLPLSTRLIRLIWHLQGMR